MKNKKILMWVVIILLMFGLETNMVVYAQETNTETLAEVPKIKNYKSVKKENDFLKELKKVLKAKVATKTYKVLKKIGFTKMEFKGRVGETLNYQIKANGYDVVITASDKLYRIFTPNKYTWYEDGKIKKKYKKKSKNKIDYNDRNSYYIIAKEIVCSGLKNPNSADFPSIITHPEDIAMKKKGKIVIVQSYVDATNSFGGVVRTKWTVQFKVKDLRVFSYKLIYLNIGGTEVGKRKKM